MPLTDFTRTWQVIDSNSTICPKNTPVKITLSDSEADGKKKLIIECDGKKAYEEATYIADTNTIDVGDYEIRLLIAFRPKSVGPVAGSWTAEDQGPWPGDEV